MKHSFTLFFLFFCLSGWGFLVESHACWGSVVLWLSVLTTKHLVTLNFPLLCQVIALMFESSSQIKCWEKLFIFKLTQLCWKGCLLSAQSITPMSELTLTMCHLRKGSVLLSCNLLTHFWMFQWFLWTNKCKNTGMQLLGLLTCLVLYPSKSPGKVSHWNRQLI